MSENEFELWEFECFCCDNTVCKFTIARQSSNRPIPKHCPIDGRLIEISTGSNWWSEIKNADRSS